MGLNLPSLLISTSTLKTLMDHLKSAVRKEKHMPEDLKVLENPLIL